MEAHQQQHCLLLRGRVQSLLPAAVAAALLPAVVAALTAAAAAAAAGQTGPRCWCCCRLLLSCQCWLQGLVLHLQLRFLWHQLLQTVLQAAVAAAAVVRCLPDCWLLLVLAVAAQHLLTILRMAELSSLQSTSTKIII